ncbi:MAG: DUF3892 domain-containing protein [Planctomycetes bacterium]|nr:DUF3892 domain-containing protein [Planctomycetota bacterium]
MRHQISCADKDRNGVIQGIGNRNRTWTRLEAVRLIRSGTASFFVQRPGTRPTDIHVYADQYLRTDPDGDSRNNLDDLGGCEFAS